MTTLILFLIAGVVVFYLYNAFNEYLKNPITTREQEANNQQAEYNFKNDPYAEYQAKKIKATPEEIQIKLINEFLKTDSKDFMISITQENAIKGYIKSLNIPSQQENLNKLIGEKNEQNLDSLAQQLNEATYGEYKKKLNFILFLFYLAFFEKDDLEENYKEKLIDIAAFLEIENDDFNKLYDSFNEKETRQEKLESSAKLFKI